MPKSMQVAELARSLNAVVEELIQPTVPVTPVPKVKTQYQIGPGVMWPVITPKETQWRMVEANGRPLPLVSEQTRTPSVADMAENPQLVAGLRSAIDEVKRLIERRRRDVLKILNEPAEREAFRELMAEHAIMQLEELQLEQ